MASHGRSAVMARSSHLARPTGSVYHGSTCFVALNLDPMQAGYELADEGWVDASDRCLSMSTQPVDPELLAVDFGEQGPPPGVRIDLAGS